MFYGENGAGKTNILEAISLFSSDRGLRKASLSDLTYYKANVVSWSLDMVISEDNYKTFLSTSAPEGRRLAKIDNTAVTSLTKFEELLWILWTVPGMDNLFIGASSDRRVFFDHLVSGYDKKHKYHLKNLFKLQKERLHIISHKNDKVWLGVLEKNMAEENIRVTKTRLEFINVLHETFRNYPSNFLRPIVNISGAVEEIYERCSEENAVCEVAESLERNRWSDTEKQTTSLSVHRTFWRVEHPQTRLEAELCSSGEQKAFIVSLILAVARIYQKFRNGVPVLLLDDLMARLDKVRRKNLVNELLSINFQTFFTGTDQYLFEELEDTAQIYDVAESIVTAI